MMGLHMIVPITITFLAISGFIFLAVTMRGARGPEKAAKGAGGGNLFHNLRGTAPLPHSDCYEKCMDDASWDPKQVRRCSSACGE